MRDHKAYYAAHKEKWAADYQRNKEAKKAKRDALREFINRLKDVPCADCGGRFPPVCMDFDHLDPSTKVRNVTQFVGYNVEAILEEVAKCDVVCANCHRIRTFREEA